MQPTKKAFVRQSECVACGCCVSMCPKAAIFVYHGMYARVNREACVGCGKCAKACPAGVIETEVAL